MTTTSRNGCAIFAAVFLCLSGFVLQPSANAQQKTMRGKIGRSSPEVRSDRFAAPTSRSRGEKPKPLQSTATITNPAPITIPSSGPAGLYPSTINIPLAGYAIQDVSVTINNFSHSFPDDVGIVLRAPSGRTLLIQDAAGDDPDMVNITYTVSDSGATQLPEFTAWAAGTYRPANYFCSPCDNFIPPGPGTTYDNPGPAGGGTATFASTFRGTDPNGTWQLFVFDFVTGDSGTIAGGWTLSITAVPALTISEFRWSGPSGINDEYVEIYNNSNSNHTVAAPDGSPGYSLVASDGVARFTIPNGTVIPARGHYLGCNSGGYSLAAYPAGDGTTATCDATYTTDIPNNAGIALFDTANALNFNLANRTDAVGTTSEANTLYREGAGLPPFVLNPFNTEYSWNRTFCPDNLPSSGTSIMCLQGGPGLPKDSGANANDFILVETQALCPFGGGCSTPATAQRLGAPSPENLSSPIQRNGLFTLTIIDPGVNAQTAPNRVRNLTPDAPNASAQGTMAIRRTVTNNSGVNVTRIRFRIVDLTTFPTSGAVADLRVRSSAAENAAISGGNPACPGNICAIRAMSLEQPPTQAPLPSGGFHSSLSVNTVTLGNPIPPGGSINIQYLLGVQTTGTFRIFINVEALP